MNESRLSDALLADALRTHLPQRPASGLEARITEAVATTEQQRPVPALYGALADADPIARRRSLLIAAALLIALTIATASAVGAMLDWWRIDPAPNLVVVPTAAPSIDPSLRPPADLDAYMADAYAALRDLPPLRIKTADQDVFYHDGAGTVRQDRLAADGGVTWLYRPNQTVELWHGPQPNVWVIGPPSDVDPRIEISQAIGFGDVEPACATRWRYLGLEAVLGRPTFHVACEVEYWMDVELRIPLTSREGSLQPNGTTPAGPAAAPSAAPQLSEVVELEVGPQPAELFAENPEGLAVMTAQDYQCSLDPACQAASPRPSSTPQRASVQGVPPSDLAALVAQARASHAHLPAFAMMIESYTYPATPESRRRHIWDGVDSTRDDTFSDGAWVVDWLRTGGRMYEHFDGWHDYGPGSGTGRIDWSFGLPDACVSGWEHRGFDLVMDRPAHHLVCGLDHAWIDSEWLLVLRAEQHPRPFESRTAIDEVVELTFEPQPAELFVPPSDAICGAACASPSQSNGP